MKNKGLILIILGVIIFNTKLYLENNNIKYHNKIINKIKDNHNTYNYYGYIEIPKYNIKRLIKEGTTNQILDNNYVGKMNIDTPNLVLLAGHNINLVFHKIHYLKENDLVYLNNEKYKVISYKEIDVNDYSILNDFYNEKTLILMTCTKNQNKRYIVICKEIKDE